MKARAGSGTAFGYPQLCPNALWQRTSPATPTCTLQTEGKTITPKVLRLIVQKDAREPEPHLPGLNQRSFNVIFSDERYANCLVDDTITLDLPVLVFVPGLDGKALPACQVERLRQKFIIVSFCHDPLDRSSWEELVTNISPTLVRLRERSLARLTVVAESFGAALALRFVGANPEELFKELVLLNPGTALMHDQLLISATTLLPLLKIDTTGRVLYKAAAVFLFKVLLTEEKRLADSSVPNNQVPFLRSIDIDQVPLDAMLHRVALLKSFHVSFTDECIRELVKIPTTLVASERDRLLKSTTEIERLSNLLPRVKRKIILKDSAHAALLEQTVSLDAMLETNSGTVNTVSSNIAQEDVDDQKFETAVQLGRQIFSPWRQLTSPKTIGGEAVRNALHSARLQGSQKRPVLLVGNHGVLGILDLSLLFFELTELLGGARFRSMADASHFEQLGDFTGGRWANFVSDLGGLPATPRNFYKLLSSGENILLFPGGAREVCRRRGEKNKIFWKSNVDFVRPAARFNAIIVPFSCLGADDSVDILIDGQELQRLPVVGPFVRNWVEEKQFSPDNVMPIASFPPKPDRFYFKFHDPIDTASVNHKDLQTIRNLYSQVKNAVEKGIDDLSTIRQRDPKRGFNTRMLRGLAPIDKEGVGQTPLGNFFKSILPTFDI